MNFRMKLGGDDKDNAHYTDGYNTGYAHAMDEMRRRTRSYDEPEDRRGRRSRAEDDRYWPIETRQIGFARHDGGDSHGDTAMLLDMMHELKESHESLKHGLASTVKKLDPRLIALLETAASVTENPPSTWEAHMKRGDYLGILRMEGKELMSALEAHKPEKEMRKELSHTLAALMELLTH